MAGTNPVATWLRNNFTTQDPATYKATLDGNAAVAQRFVDNFAPRQTTTPAMTITLDPGHVFNNGALTEKTAQTSGTITAPGSNPRIDRAVIDAATGILSIITGTAAGSPVAPAIPLGKLPVAQILLQTSSTTITNAMITDEREFVESNGRIVLTGALSLYVRTDGSDSNSGLANTAAGAFLTIQKAINVAASLDLNGQTVTINVADGTYTGNVTVNGPWVGTGTVQLTGNTTTPANCILSTTSADCIDVNPGGTLSVKGFKLATTTSGSGIISKGVVTVNGNMNYGAVASGYMHLQALNGGEIDVLNSYTISGNAGYHLYAGDHGRIIYNATLTVTLSGTPAFGGAFAQASRLGDMGIPSGFVTFSGSATGTRYVVNGNSIIDTTAGGGTYLPGNAAGSTATGGQYV